MNIHAAVVVTSRCICLL